MAPVGSQELEFAVGAAREAGAITLRYFQDAALAVDTKADGSPVTRADREAERLLRERIGEAYPADGILGEEEGEHIGESGRVWILDPVDGTKSFARGVPLYGTMIGLEENGQAVLGVVYFSALREMMFAARGCGAWWLRDIGGDEQRVPARVSEVSELGRALLCVTSVGSFVHAGEITLYAALRGVTGLDRGWSDCYGHMLVATGRADVHVDPWMNVWDCAALQPIVEEAGGSFTDLAGNATHRGGSGVSTNAALRDAVLAITGVGR